MAEGLACYVKVRKAVDEAISPDVKVLLKRACTEMEHGIGPSDQWQLKPGQLEFEARLNQRFVNELPLIQQSDHAKDDIHQRWIERAYEVGDDTYRKFADGPLYPDYVTYHHLADEANMEKIKSLAVENGGANNISEVENGKD